MEYLGEGCSSFVYLNTDEFVVEKHHKSVKSYRLEKQAVNYIRTHKFKHVIRYHDTDDESLVITMEYCPYNLEKMIVYKNVMDKDTLMCDIISCLYALHNNDIIHGDFKAKNIMVNTDSEVKVIDFDLSTFQCTNKQKKLNDLNKCKLLTVQLLYEISYTECYPNYTEYLMKIKTDYPSLYPMMSKDTYNLKELYDYFA